MHHPESSLRKQEPNIRAFTPVFDGLCSRVLLDRLRSIGPCFPKDDSWTGWWCVADKKAGHRAGLETRLLCSREAKFLGPDLLQTPGGWGLRNPVLESRPGPEVTGACVTFQLGRRLSEIRQQYDVIEESMRLPNPDRTGVDPRYGIDINPASCPRARPEQSSVKLRSYLKGGAA
jgi:hypothetical protein